MENNVTLVWSFRNRVDVLRKSIETADKYCPKKVNFCLVDASSNESSIRELREFCTAIHDRSIRICESAYRTTLSEAWNLGIMLSSTRFVVFVSSDVEFTSDQWLRGIANRINAGYEYVLVENHSVFLIDKKAIPKMGWFDETYKLGPHFDTDLMIRGSEAGVRFGIIGSGNSYKHEDTAEETQLRKTAEVADRLPMNTKDNDIIFKDKWETGWEGWDNREHPPTNINQVRRKRVEVDPHPFFTKKYSGSEA